LPESNGPQVTLSEKLYVPVKEHPDVSMAMSNQLKTSSIVWVIIITRSLVGLT